MKQITINVTDKSHKSAEMIAAKAENINLVLFKRKDDEWHLLSDTSFMVFDEISEYFLCLPQHNENGQCLHWLNGGKVQCKIDATGDFRRFPSTDEDWFKNSPWMSKDFEFRIKPKTERRWIAVHPKNAKAEVFFDEEVCDNCMLEPIYQGFHKIEIEIEV